MKDDMMRIRILRDHDHALGPAQTLAFKANTEDNRPRAMAEELISLGVAEAMPALTKPAKEN